MADREGTSRTGPYGLGESTNSPFFGNILAGFKPDEQPLTPAGAEMFRKNRQGTGTKNPQSYCLPDGVPHGILLPESFKIIQMAGETLFLYEVETIFRQIYTDGRKLANPDMCGPHGTATRWAAGSFNQRTAGKSGPPPDQRGTSGGKGDSPALKSKRWA